MSRMSHSATRAVLSLALSMSLVTPAFAGTGVLTDGTATAQTPLAKNAPAAGRLERVTGASPAPAASASDEATTTGEVLIAYESGERAEAVSEAREQGAEVVSTSTEAEFVVVEPPSGLDEEAFAEKIAKDDAVAYAEPVMIRRASAVIPNDYFWPAQANLVRIGAPIAWETTQGAPTVRIAVIDSGVNLNHEDLQGRIETASAYDFVDGDTNPTDTFGHGTQIAGIIAATANNTVGIAGLANECTIVPLRVLDSNGEGDTAAIAQAVVAATEAGVDVINLSLESDEYSQAERDAIDAAIDAGIVVVAAAGNSVSFGGLYPVAYPARYPRVIAVGSADENDLRSDFSRIGPQLDLVAPGEYVESTDGAGANNAYEYLTGTSAAAPQVSAAAALLKSVNADWTPAQIEAALKDQAEDLGVAGRDDEFGWGMLRVDSAITLAEPPAMPSVGDDDIPGIPLPSSPILGSLDEVSDSNDVFAVELEANERIEVELDADPTELNAVLSMFGPDATGVDLDMPIDGSLEPMEDYPQTLSFRAEAAGTYYLCAFALSGSGDYRLEWDNSNGVSVSGPATVTWGSTAQVTASVEASGFPVVNNSVTLETSWDGTSWTPLPSGPVATDEVGEALFSFEPTGTIAYRAVSTVGGTEFTSSPATLTIDPFLTVKAPTDVVRYKSFTVSGALKPKHTAGVKDITLTFRLGSTTVITHPKNVTYKHTTTGEVYTRYSASVQLPKAGKWTVTASVEADGDRHNAWTTPDKSIYVNRPKLSIYQSRSTVTYNTSAVISGYLKTREGNPMPGRIVYVDRSADGENWTPGTKAHKTSSTGRVAIRVRSDETTYYRFRFEGERSHMARKSSSVKIRPKIRYWEALGATGSPLVADDDGWMLLPAGKYRLTVYTTWGLYSEKYKKSVFLDAKVDGKAEFYDNIALAPEELVTYYVKVPEKANYRILLYNSLQGKANGNDIYVELW